MESVLMMLYIITTMAAGGPSGVVDQVEMGRLEYHPVVVSYSLEDIL